MANLVKALKVRNHGLAHGSAVAAARRLVAEGILEFLRTAPNPFAVSGDHPIMDDRYLYPERPPGDGPPPLFRGMALADDFSS